MPSTIKSALSYELNFKTVKKTFFRHCFTLAKCDKNSLNLLPITNMFKGIFVCFCQWHPEPLRRH